MKTKNSNFDLLSYVDTLHEKSTTDEINQALHYDFKKEAIGYYEQIIEDNALKQKVLSRIEEYRYKDDNTNSGGNPILNWLRYAITGGIVKEEFETKYGKEYYKTINLFDCDSSALAKELYQRLWPNDIDTYGGETMNSFWSTYKAVVPLYAPLQKVENRSIGILANQIEKFNWIGMSANKQLSQFATLTHTIGNFMRCPNGSPSFNLAKGNQTIIGDYPDNMFKWLNGEIDGEIVVGKEKVEVDEETKQRWNEWVKQRKDSYFLDIYFKDDKPISLFSRTPKELFPKNKSQLNEYLIRTNAIIEFRGIKMLIALNPKLNDNAVLRKRLSKLEKILSKRVCASKIPYPVPTEKEASRIENKYINTMGLEGRKSFYFTKNPIKRVKKNFSTAINSIKYAPFFHGSRLSMYLATVLAVIMMVITIALLFTRGHFASQIQAIQNSGANAAFTDSYNRVAAPIYYNKHIFMCITVLFMLAFVGLYIDYFVSSTKGKRIAMLVSTAISAIMVSIPATIYSYYKYLTGLYLNGSLNENSLQAEFFVKILNLLANKTFLIVYGSICVSAIIGILVLLIFSDVRPLLKTLVLSVAVIYIALPLVLLLIENIIPLITWVLIIIGVGIGIWFVFGVVLSGNGGGSQKASPTYAESISQSVMSVKPAKTQDQLKAMKQKYLDGLKEAYRVQAEARSNTNIFNTADNRVRGYISESKRKYPELFESCNIDEKTGYIK